VVAALLPSVVSPPRRSRRSYAKPAGRPRAPASARTWWYMLAPVSPRSHTAGPGQVVDHMPRPLAIHLGGLRLPAGTYGLPCRPRIFPKNLRLGRGRTAGDRPPAVRPSAEWWEQLAEWAAVAVLPEAHRVPMAYGRVTQPSLLLYIRELRRASAGGATVLHPPAVTCLLACYYLCGRACTVHVPTTVLQHGVTS
jgi:hypothetical protein